MASDLPHHDPNENTYQIDFESGTEMARLIDQDKAVTDGMGGLFSERTDLSTIFDVLDIGCGPGGWALEVAHIYPEMEVTGIDISNSMIDYANAYAQVRLLPNVHFRVMNAVRPLDFPDESFDLINARFIVGAVHPSLWSTVLVEYKRILRPNGIMRWTEGEWTITNKPALDTLGGLLTHLMQVQGMGYSPAGRTIGITAMQRRFLRNAGFQNIEAKAYAIDYSAGTRGHQALCLDYKLFFMLMQPLFIGQQLITEQEMNTLYEQMLTEVQADDFCATSHVLTAWGQK